MDKDFWLKKWEHNEIGFHESKVNPLLVEYFHKLQLANNSRLFIPLCGKTKDIEWLLDQGYVIVGAELSTLAINELFRDLGLEPNISKNKRFTLFSSQNIDIFVGDIFELSKKDLGPINAIYDRAALVALPKNVRFKYTSHLMDISNSAPQFLISLEYDEMLMNGPPFSVNSDEIKEHYTNHYQSIQRIKSNIPAAIKGGKFVITQSVWLMNRT